ncbi:MAG: tetratricopeptide repeat protein, partial [Thermoanaerobaculia bacterium]
MRRSFAAVVLLCASLPLFAESAHEALVRIGAIWSTGDRDRFATVLAPSFPGTPLHLARMKARFRARCITVRSVTATITSEDDTRATGLLTFHIAESPRTGPPGELVDDVEVEMSAEGGSWRVVKWMRVVDAVALRLSEAAPSADVMAMTHPALPDRELVHALERRTVDLSNLSRMAEAKKAAAAAQVIAEQLGDEPARVMADLAELMAMTVPTVDPAARRRRILQLHERALRTADPDAVTMTTAYVGRMYLDLDESSREAERIFVRMVEQDEEYSEPTTMVVAAARAGVTRLTRGDYRGALQLFRRGLDRSIELQDPANSAYLRLHIGRIYDRQNDPELAVAEYRQGLQVVPRGTIPEALIRQALARSLRRLGNAEEADREL